jgi:hypothetical protein
VHLDLHPSVGNVSIHSGQLSLESVDFHDSGRLEVVTTCTVRTDSPLAEGPVDGIRLESVLFPDSPAQVLVVCTAWGGTAEYFLFDPVDPNTCVRLRHARKAGKLFITGHHAGEVIDAPVEGQLLDIAMPGMRPGKTAPERAEWVLNAAQVAQTLPHICSFWAPDLLQVADHRAYLMLAA